MKLRDGILEGHADCAKYLENQVAQLLLRPVVLDGDAQQQLLQELQPVFTPEDNAMLSMLPTKQEVKRSIAIANLHGAPGTDGITSYLYHICWKIVGDIITEVCQAIQSWEPSNTILAHLINGVWFKTKESNIYQTSRQEENIFT